MSHRQVRVHPGHVRHSDPRVPESYPGYGKSVKIAKRFMADPNVSNAEKRDAMRIYNNNPNNLPGMPDFYGKKKTVIGVHMEAGTAAHLAPIEGNADLPSHDEETDVLPCGDRWVRATYQNIKGNKYVKIFQCREGHVFKGKEI